MALMLAGLLAAAAAALLQTQAALSRNTTHHAQAAELMRTTAHVLTAETRWSNANLDLRAAGVDSIALRAFRASGVVVRVQSDGSLLVRLNALRAPDATKDSVLVLTDYGRELRAQLINALATTLPCGPGDCYLLQITATAAAGDVLLIFESGNYYLTTRALRYRLGAEGRQPLTTDLLDDPLTFFDLFSSSAWLSTRAAAGPVVRMRVRLPFLNQAE
jgi:hypothetical protein